ncbi:MAG: NapC/NirT family cytochrome c [Deltaproteobacteria bacterium]|jgi:cytochrome c nitrite reductase small subunit|nr:NapC/NirT family cytochrome c [Deltaproteobacteria bacterium]
MGTPRTGSGLKCLLSGVVLGVVLLAASAIVMRATDQRPFCSSCHLMETAAVTHKLSSHANVACDDCHAPVSLGARLSFKASSGLNDFVGNLSGKEISMPVSLRTKDVVNNNCKLCHAMTNLDVASMETKAYCVNCHRNVAHMRAKPISTRMVADE